MDKRMYKSEISITPRIPAKPNANPPVQEVTPVQTTGATFQINNAKLYDPVVTLAFNDSIKFLENIKQGFKRTISWSKNRSEIIKKPKNNNLDYLTGPASKNTNRSFVLHSKFVMIIVLEILLMSITCQ